MADSLSEFFPSLIDSSQIGFVEGHSAVAYIRRVLMVLDRVKKYCNMLSSPSLLTIDRKSI